MFLQSFQKAAMFSAIGLTIGALVTLRIMNMPVSIQNHDVREHASVSDKRFPTLAEALVSARLVRQPGLYIVQGNERVYLVHKGNNTHYIAPHYVIQPVNSSAVDVVFPRAGLSQRNSWKSWKFNETQYSYSREDDIVSITVGPLNLSYKCNGMSKHGISNCTVSGAKSWMALAY